MSAAANVVACDDHGKRRIAYVCAHIVESLRDGQPRGFWWSRDEDDSINACCDACEQVRIRDGGWTDENVKVADVKILCEECAVKAGRLNGEGIAVQ